MDVSAAIKGSRSVRSYAQPEVESGKIEAVLGVGRLSPSANKYRSSLLRDHNGGFHYVNPRWPSHP